LLHIPEVASPSTRDLLKNRPVICALSLILRRT
jgi:hypothetical protein